MTRLLLLCAAVSACGGDGGTLDRSTDAATDSGGRGRLVITSNGNGDILQLAIDGGAGELADAGVLDGGSLVRSTAEVLDGGQLADAAADACVLEDCFCFGAFPNVCCKPGGACGCRYMNLECR